MGWQEDPEALENFSRFFLNGLFRQLFPIRGLRTMFWWIICDGPTELLPSGRPWSSSAQDSRHQQKCVVSKGTWHFSSTTQLLSELATCAPERKGKWGVPEVLSLEFANTQGERENQSLMAYKKKIRACILLSFVAMGVIKASGPAPSILPGTGEEGLRGWRLKGVVRLKKDGPSLSSVLSPWSLWVLRIKWSALHPKLSIFWVHVTTYPLVKN